MRTRAVVLSALVIVGLGCSPASEQPVAERPAEPPWEQIAHQEMAETQEAQRELALAAVDAMMSEMMGELESALDSGGPAAGIAVCRERAPAIAGRVSDQFGVVIGRTSFALRNPENLPPDWADALVEQRVGEPSFLAGPDGQLGVLLPIRLKAECQMCHGPKEMIAEEVQEAISEHYPDDRAVGFTEGDLRGWFWIEVPGGAPPTESTDL